jgi:hypothetical protein
MDVKIKIANLPLADPNQIPEAVFPASNAATGVTHAVKIRDIISGDESSINRHISVDQEAIGGIQDTGQNLQIPLPVAVLSSENSDLLPSTGIMSLGAWLRHIRSNVGWLFNRIFSIVPNQASSTNQLADKDFVNSSISNMAARYMTPDSLGEEQWPSLTALRAGPWYNGGTPKEPSQSDYAIYVESDNSVWRAAYNGDLWSPTYKINDKPFTAAQLAALNSSITAQLVMNFSNHLSNIDNPHGVTAQQVQALPITGGMIGGGYMGNFATNNINASKVSLRTGSSSSGVYSGSTLTNEGLILSNNNTAGLDQVAGDKRLRTIDNELVLQDYNGTNWETVSKASDWARNIYISQVPLAPAEHGSAIGSHEMRITQIALIHNFQNLGLGTNQIMVDYCLRSGSGTPVAIQHNRRGVFSIHSSGTSSAAIIGRNTLINNGTVTDVEQSIMHIGIINYGGWWRLCAATYVNIVPVSTVRLLTVQLNRPLTIDAAAIPNIVGTTLSSLIAAYDGHWYSI